MARTDKIVEAIRQFVPTEDGDWSEFISLLDELWNTNEPQKGYKALFDVMIKFEDDMEGEWQIIHGMEHFGGYEVELVKSLKQRPTFHTLVMLSRIINVQEKEIAGVRIEDLLGEILLKLSGNQRLKQFAEGCVERLRNGKSNSKGI